MINNLHQKEVAQKDYEALWSTASWAFKIPPLSWTAQALSATLRLERKLELG